MKPCVFYQYGRVAEIFCRSNHFFEVASIQSKKCPFCGNKLKEGKKKYNRYKQNGVYKSDYS